MNKTFNLHLLSSLLAQAEGGKWGVAEAGGGAWEGYLPVQGFGP